MRLIAGLLALLAITALANRALAIDDGHLAGLKRETAEKVLMSFRAPAFYLVTQKGGELRSSVSAQSHIVTRAHEQTTILFITANDAAEYGRHIMRNGTIPSSEQVTVRVTNLNNIMVAIYLRQVDFVIMETAKPAVLIITTFVDSNLQHYVHTINGKRFIPAFLTHASAQLFESKYLPAGKYTRLGIDFLSHLGLIQSHLDTDTPVVTFGEMLDETLNDVARSGI